MVQQAFDVRTISLQDLGVSHSINDGHISSFTLIECSAALIHNACSYDYSVFVSFHSSSNGDTNGDVGDDGDGLLHGCHGETGSGCLVPEVPRHHHSCPALNLI